jgi:type IV pilus assembly protein PilY1
MRIFKSVTRPLCTMLASAACTLQVAVAQVAPDISDVPLFLSESVAPLNMLVMGRDHKLYYEAYNDHSDLNGDGVTDVTYDPTRIDYYGYFDSGKCYSYSSGDGRFNPTSTTANKQCAGSSEWSGDFLNYLTTSRIDALRKVLYGGFRRVDTSSETVLERTHIPQDAHSWVKEYRGSGTSGYDIALYSPLGEPESGKAHLLANVSLMLTTSWTTNDPVSSPPLLRVAENVSGPQNRAWHWASTESPVAGACYGRDAGTNDGRCTGQGGTGQPIASNSSSFTDYTVRVAVCVDEDSLEANCQQYPDGNYKPVGLLQQYGESGSMDFGLITGSYQKSKSGGVLRKEMGDLQGEIDADDGTFNSGTNGIIATLNKLRSAGYDNYRGAWYLSAGRGAGAQYEPGLVTTRPFDEGEFGGMWGNSVAEMMYEALRYFAGRNGPTSEFDYSGTTFDSELGLPKDDNWSNPYASGKPFCAKPFMTVISDINPSHDTDQLPGAYFPGTQPGDDVGGLNVATEADEIWAEEFGGNRNIFIGQSGAIYDGAPSPKTASSFGNIRGLSPEEPTRQGGYYAASVAKHGFATDINVRTGDQKVQTFAVALASPLPRIEIPVGGGTVTLVPFAKSVAGAGIDADAGDFQPTNQIVDFYVESISADQTSGSFLINFEDVEGGNDHDMDTVVRYSYAVEGGQVRVTVNRLYEAGGITHHMGYTISGTTQDGIYLVVQDDNSQLPLYFLDTPDGTDPGDCSSAPHCSPRPSAPRALPWTDSRLFTPGTSGAAMLLKDPLWYAAKWGGFTDSDDNGLPNVQTEWDEDGDGNPDNYFLVTNALNLGAQLESAFDEILARNGSASSASVNSGSISSETRLYQAKFNSEGWSGQLLAFAVNQDGSLDPTEEWDASKEIPDPNSRTIITVNSDGTTAVPFRWTNDLDATRKAQLDLASDGFGEQRLNYLRGDGTREAQNAPSGLPQFRDRPETPYRNVLGDIVSSAPVFVGRPPFLYPDVLESQPYSAFITDNEDRRQMVYAGANDGMLHAFDAGSGEEQLAFIPGAVFPDLHELTSPSYSHRFYVDAPPTMGDAFFGGAWHTVLVGGLNKGGKSIYALDITDPDAFSEGNADDVFLWERSAAGDDDLGYTYSRPAVVRLHNGKWAAVFGNGYNSVNGRAVLYIVDIADGSIIRKIDTGVGTGGNGLSTPALVDLNGDSRVDLAYAGDLAGNLWKFRLNDNNPATVDNEDPNDWDVAYKAGTTNLPLFSAVDGSGVAQPITSRPEVGRGPNGAGTMVLFGTGRYLGVADKTPTQTQTFYGIRDPNTTLDSDRVSGRVELTQQQIVAEEPVTFTDPDGATVSASVRVTTSNVVTNRGWYLDLLQPPVPGTFQGEMQVSDSILRTGRIIFTTLIPDPDPCSPGGTSWLMELDALSGARLTSTPFDMNRDGEFNDEDNVEVDIDGDGVPDLAVPVSGIQSEVGITPKPGILAGPNAEYKYTPGTTGNIQVTVENPGPSATGRQSWRQIR